MRRLLLTSRAESDLRRIEEHITRDNPAAALATVDRIIERCRSLIEFPDQGSPMPGGRQRVLVSTGTPYLAFYRATAEMVAILHVRHARQRPQH